MNISLIGCGITNSLITFLLRNVSCYIDIWEAEAEMGGRMKTFRAKNYETGLDIGAQYITTSPEFKEKHDDVYSFLLENNLLQPLNCDIINMRQSSSLMFNYVASEGTCSLIKHLINSNVRDIFLSRPVSNLNVCDGTVEMVDDDGKKTNYDIVILTIPIPNLLKLKGNFKRNINEDVFQKLHNVEYSQRFCLIALFNRKLPISWGAMYTPQDPIFRYIGIQENKVGATIPQSSVIIHSTIEFGKKYQNNNEEVESILTNRMKSLFPEWNNPDIVKIYKWDYSQIIKPYANSPGSIVINENPLIIIAGDAFTTSNFDGCIISAKSAVDVIKSYDKKKLQSKNNYYS